MAEAPRSVAVIGGGIAGLSSAYHIARHSPATRVTLFEQEGRLGGHEMPVETAYGAVDLGYMVLNRHTYPNLLRFYAQHSIHLDATDMGFAIDTPAIAWCFKSGLAAAARLLCEPRFWAFFRDKSRFHSEARAFLAGSDTEGVPHSATLAEFCQRHGYGPAFVQGWLQPFCEAVWSTPKAEALAMEAFAILSFLRNHGFLNWSHVQWYTPRGRTTGTLHKFAALFEQLSVETVLNAGVSLVERLPDGRVAVVVAGTGDARIFDHVVIAAPAGAALKLLKNPTPEDCEVLGGFRCSSNRIVLHTDPRLMPRRKELWASWNVIERTTGGAKALLSYWVKPLQHVKHDNLFITLNPPEDFWEEKEAKHVLLERWALHPVMDVAALACQRKVWAQHQGRGNIWYAGAYLHWGFHEDGFRSGIEVARRLLQTSAIPLLPVEVEAFHETHFAFKGKTTHIRFDPSTGKIVHNFSYNLSYDYLPASSAFQPWWGGLCRRDHFGDVEKSLDTCVREAVLKATGVFPDGSVDMITCLREWGYCFNPITIYLCWDSTARNRVTYLVSEVTNTPWGQITVQVIDLSQCKTDGRGYYIAERPKTLHVSPMNPVPDGQATWRYTFKPPSSSLQSFDLTVELFEDPGCQRKKIMAGMHLVRFVAEVLVEKNHTFFDPPKALVLLLTKGQRYHGNKVTDATVIEPSHPQSPQSVLLWGVFWVVTLLAAVAARWGT